VTSIDLDELDDEHEQRHDFRRANGAPLVSDPADPSKTLRYSRPSSYAKCLDDEEALNTWKMWKAMEGVARSPGLIAQVAATKDDDKVSKKELRDKALDRGTANERSDLGTGLHAMTARAEDAADTMWEAPEQYAGDLSVYVEALERYGLVAEMTEAAMVNDRYRAAGTADRIFGTTKPLWTPNNTLIEPGELVLADLKTGAKLDFSLPGYCVQMALYATGQLYDVVAERRLPTPPINQAWTILVHLPAGKQQCTLHWCSVELGLVGAGLAFEVREWRKAWKNGTYDSFPIDEPRDVPVILEAELGATVAGEVTIAVMAEWCQGRINAIGANADAKTALIRMWPEGLPTPKKGIQDNQQLITLLNLLDAIETQFSIPFGTSDPRLAHQMGKNRDEIDRSNEFMLT
jgi:hypothetical protein